MVEVGRGRMDEEYRWSRHMDRGVEGKRVMYEVRKKGEGEIRVIER